MDKICICETCSHWEASDGLPHGTCFEISGEDRDDSVAFIQNDSALRPYLKTKPEFFCFLYERLGTSGG